MSKKTLLEKAFLVAIVFDKEPSHGWGASDIIDELKELVTSSGLEVAGDIIVKRSRPTARLLIGSGKAEQIGELATDAGAEVIITSRDLSPAQARNLEELTQLKVIDRTQLILDIFAQRAKSNEGKLEVELAQLVYLLPRLTGRGILLSRLGGGIGTRGPGEQVLETARRSIRDQIVRLKKDLLRLKDKRASLRKGRLDKLFTTVALVGYTNAGKSTLLNTLTASDEVTENQLFSTLDPVVRKLVLPNKQKLLLVDTVGFLHELPHHLIESFKATLEEAVGAEMLLHVVDISHPKAYQHAEAVYEILEELKIKDKPIITVLNKIDQGPDKDTVERFIRHFPNCVPVSALKKENIAELTEILTRMTTAVLTPAEFLVPHSKMKLVNLIYREGEILEREDTAEGIRIKALLPALLVGQIEKEIASALRASQ